MRPAPGWKSLELGSPLHASQVEPDPVHGRATLVLATQPLTRQVCLATALDDQVGQVLWQRQLGMVCQADPLELQRPGAAAPPVLLVLDRGGGLFAFDPARHANLADGEWREGGQLLFGALDDGPGAAGAVARPGRTIRLRNRHAGGRQTSRCPPRAAAGDAGVRAGPFAARDCGYPCHPVAVWHARRVGDSAVGAGGKLGAEAAHWNSQIAGTPELSEPADCGLPEIRRSGPGPSRRRRTQSRTGGGAGLGASDRLLTGTRSFASGLLETVLVFFFLLVSGDTFLRRLVEILPRFRNKRQAVDISQQIESDVSAYLFTITIMNLAVGVATGTVVALCGVGDPCCGARSPSCSTTFRSSDR